MNILVLNGSPRENKSNTMKLTRKFLEGAGWTDAEILNIGSMNINPCKGCFACWNKTPGKCVIRDDMNQILEKIIAADVIIWSFPLYYFNVPGGLKNLIDRQLPLNLPYMDRTSESGFHIQRYDLSKQKHIIISTCGFWTAKGNYSAVFSMFDHFIGKDNYTSILCGQGELFGYPQLSVKTEPYLEIVRRAGKEYINGKIEENTKRELKKPLFSREVFEDMADASWGIEQKDNTEVQLDESLSLTRQMAALYRPDGKNRVLEMSYTDIDKTYQVLLTDKGSEVITENFRPYTTRIETPFSVWKSISNGEISGQDAFFQSKFKVHGDIDLMLNWDNLFGIDSPEDVEPLDSIEKSGNKKPNMIVLLFPWIIFWSLFPINTSLAGIVGILTVALVPLLWIVFKPVVYEQVGISVLTVLSLSCLIGLHNSPILAISYFLFGLIWIIGAINKIPLTANYSSSKIGGVAAYSNPIFMKTNRMLTALWGGLFILFSLIAYYLQNTALSDYLGLILGLPLLIMSGFTAWFQRWFPKKMAEKIGK